VSHRPLRRRTPPPLIGFILSVAAVIILAGVILGFWAWQQVGQIGELRSELATLQGEYQAAMSQLGAVQATATALQGRMTALEASDPARQLAAIGSAAETARTPEELAGLRASLAEVEANVNSLQSTVDGLVVKLETMDSSRTVGTQALPPEAHLSVARQRQSHNLSCEATAASMAAQYQGVSLSEAEVLAALPRNDNPYLGFRGNPDGPTGGIEDYGVYAGPIINILNAQELRAWLVEGGLDGIREAITRGNPVIAWVTYDCQPGTPTVATISGQQVTLVPYQHVVVVTGYSAEGVWANDPWDGQEDFYSIADFQRAMSYFGDMAIEVTAL
jgi:uncharacterized protein YvpB